MRCCRIVPSLLISVAASGPPAQSGAHEPAWRRFRTMRQSLALLVLAVALPAAAPAQTIAPFDFGISPIALATEEHSTSIGTSRG